MAQHIQTYRRHTGDEYQRRRGRLASQTIADAPDGALIQFAAEIAGQTIAVSDAIKIHQLLTVEGPIPQGITRSGGLLHTSLALTATSVTIRNLSIVNGRGDYGGLRGTGRLTLENTLVANNEGTINGGGIAIDATTSV